MKHVKTRDNTITFFSEEFQEHYHSLTGALEEAEMKYVKPLRVKNGDCILDFCFGLGYNSYAAMVHFKHLTIVALENDQHVLDELQKLELPAPYDIIKKIAKDHHYTDQDYILRLVLGDAAETILSVTERFDIVFFDPFSPKRCPHLWTFEIFQAVFNRMKPGARLGTYSCARAVRDNMRAAGFIVADGPSVGRRGPSTIATKPL